MIPRIYNRSYTISADLLVPARAEGVIVAEADHLGGFSLFVDAGRLTHTYSMMGVFVYRQQADTPLPTGEVNVRMEFAADAAKPATGGQVTLFVNDAQVGGGRMDHTVPMRFSAYAGMDIGRDNGGVVDLELRRQAAVRVHRHGQEGRLRREVPSQGQGRAGRPRARAPRPRCARALVMNPTAGLKVLSLPFDHETTDVLIGSYLSHDAAHDDYRAALACGGYLHGAIVVAKDMTGKVRWNSPTTWSAKWPRDSAPSGSSPACWSSRWYRSPPASAPRWAAFSARLCTWLTETKVKGQAATRSPSAAPR